MKTRSIIGVIVLFIFAAGVTLPAEAQTPAQVQEGTRKKREPETENKPVEKSPAQPEERPQPTSTIKVRALFHNTRQVENTGTSSGGSLANEVNFIGEWYPGDNL